MKMISSIRNGAFFALALSLAIAGTAQSEPSLDSSKSRPTLQVSKPIIPISKDFTLDNGLRVIVSEDHSVPVASFAMIYDVGARDEQKGKSGFAHLFEHMMFEGSENVKKGEFFKYVQSSGGQFNASTHADFTDYWERLPSNNIELSFWLESDRLRSLKITPENFKNQQETVKEEKRKRIDNQPYSPAAVKTDELIFDNWANKHPVIGYIEDLEAASADDAKNFFEKYYIPNNAVIAVVGDVNSNEIADYAKKYFGTIPKGKLPERPDVSEPETKTPRYLKTDDIHARSRVFWMAWKAPPRRNPDAYVLHIIESLLTGGGSSRLYQRLVKEDQTALRVRTSYTQRRGPSEFDIFVVQKPGTEADSIRKVIVEEVDKLKNGEVSDKELEKEKNQILRALYGSSQSSLQRTLARAQILARYASFYGDPTLADADVDAYLGVTAGDVQRVAKKVFTEEGITVSDVIPVKPN